MKYIGNFILMAIVVLALTITMAACKSKGGSDTSATSYPPGATATQGQQTASWASQSAGMTQGSGAIFLNLGNLGLNATGATTAPGLKTSKVFQTSPAMNTFINVTEKMSKSRVVSAASNSIKRSVGMLKSQIASAPSTTDGRCKLS